MIPLEDFQRFLNSTTSNPDTRAEMQLHLDAATRKVESLCGPLAGGTTTVTAHAIGKVLVLPVVRVAAVTALRDPQGTVTAPATGGGTNLPAGVVGLPYASPGVWEADVTTAGPAGEVPADLKLAVLIVAKHLWLTQRGAGARPGLALADGEAEPVGYAIPRRAAELMAPYRLPEGVG